MTALICVLQDVRRPAEVLNGSLCAWGLNTGDHSHPLPQCLQSLQSSYWSLSTTWVVYHRFDKPPQSRSFITCTNGLFSISLVGCYCLPSSSQFCPSYHCCHCCHITCYIIIHCHYWVLSSDYFVLAGRQGVKNWTWASFLKSISFHTPIFSIPPTMHKHFFLFVFWNIYMPRQLYSARMNPWP